MSNLPPTNLQPIAGDIARAIWTADGEQVRALYAELAKLVPPIPEPPKTSIGDRQSPDRDQVGIWGRESSDTNSPYRRLDPYRSDWRLWADIDEIPVASRGRRIVWLGESAARGYFYDPVFAPAMVLQKLLRHQPELHDVEVVDLARSNIDPLGIVEVAKQALRLKPDLFILFAGNNWSSAERYDAATRRDLMDGLATRGYRGFIEIINRWRVERTATTMDLLAGIARSAGAPVIVVVPESNLLDWPEDGALLVPILSDDRNGRWRNLALQAEAAFDAGQIPEAARLAAQLTKLDEGTSPVGFSILARCQYHDGQTAAARQLFEAARDTCRALPLKLSPGCARTIQDGLRKSARKHGFHIVDLPELMGERLHGELPDRRMFLDYCHLTSAGIRLLTEAVARVALPLMDVGNPLDTRDAIGKLSISPGIEADAHFMAAIHCARWHDSGDLIRFHCVEAARLSPHVIDRMASYLETFGRAGPPWLGRRFSRLIGERRSPTYRYFCEVSPFAEEKLQNEALIDALNRTIEKFDPVSRPRHRHASAAGHFDAWIDLLSRKHVSADGLHSTSYALHRPTYFESYEPVSRFVVRLADPKKFRLEMTYRTPSAKEQGHVSLHVNAMPKGVFPARADWASVKLPDIVLDSARNELAITWPTGDGASGPRLERSLAQLRRGILPNPLVEYGHCYRLRLVATL